MAWCLPLTDTEYILVSKRSVQRLLSAVCSAGDCAILDLQPPEFGPPAGGPSFRENPGYPCSHHEASWRFRYPLGGRLWATERTAWLADAGQCVNCPPARAAIRSARMPPRSRSGDDQRQSAASAAVRLVLLTNGILADLTLFLP